MKKMNLQTSLFQGHSIYLAGIDRDRDAEVESRWTHQASYVRMLSIEPMHPMPPSIIKKRYEEIEKEIDQKRSQFYFTIHKKDSDEVENGRLLGFVHIFWIEWPNAAGGIRMGIGDPQDWRKGYGGEALALALRYCFNEINLYRLDARIPEYNLAACRLFEKAGFSEETRQREYLKRDGRRWDLIHMGLLNEEWALRTRDNALAGGNHKRGIA
jgi:RimJ/RimL family protein N-acetyltransferase